MLRIAVAAAVLHVKIESPAVLGARNNASPPVSCLLRPHVIALFEQTTQIQTGLQHCPTGLLHHIAAFCILLSVQSCADLIVAPSRLLQGDFLGELLLRKDGCS
jgi:hypothetical protein